MLDFFPQYHRPDELTSSLIATLAGYDALARAAPELPTNVLVSMASPTREAELHGTVPPRGYLVATTTAHHGTGPAEAIWLPLGSSGPRRRLADLAHPYTQAPERP